jgi:hypothetical protein
MKNQRTDNESRLKELRSKRMALIALAIALGGTPVLTAGCSNTQTAIEETTERKAKEHKKSSEETETQIAKEYKEVNKENLPEVLDRLLISNYKTSEYKILECDMSPATKLQEEFLNELCGTITKYHEQTHKENNFRLSEDGDCYLDFNINEILSLNLVLNNYSQEELNEVLGNYTLTKEELNIALQHIYMNLMVYYMTAKEPSGISDLIKDEDKKVLFERIEEKALNLNKDYSEENINDFLSEEIVEAVFKQDKEALEQMDFETLLSAIPVIAVAQRRFSDPLESRDITTNVTNAMLNVTDETTTKIENAMPGVEEYYYEQIDKSNEIITKDEEKSVKKLKEEVKEKFKDVYGTELKQYMSEEDLNSYLIKFYKNGVYESNLGSPLSSVMGCINYDLLEGKYGSIKDSSTLHMIRLDLLLKEIENSNQSYNDKETEDKKLSQAKVKVLKRHI